jgi:hypothetical protein
MNNSKASNGNGLAELEKRLWAAADQLWANSPLRPSEYSTPVRVDLARTTLRDAPS